MRIKPFAATGSPGILVPSARRLIVETLSVQVDVTPPGTRLEAFVNYKSAGQDIQLFVPLIYAYTEPSTNFDFHVAMQNVHLYGQKDDHDGYRLCPWGESRHAVSDGVGTACLSPCNARCAARVRAVG